MGGACLLLKEIVIYAHRKPSILEIKTWFVILLSGNFNVLGQVLK